MISSLIGIIASSGGVAGGDYESIATTTVGFGGTATITFSSIPSTYTHLQLRGIVRGTNAANEVGVYLRINSDSGTNYSNHFLAGNGTSASAGAYTSETRFIFGQVAASTSTSSTFGVAVLDILDYTNTNKYKTGRSLTGTDRNGGGTIVLYSSLWMNTNAVTDLSLNCTAGNFEQYSQFALYGIKG